MFTPKCPHCGKYMYPAVVQTDIRFQCTETHYSIQTQSTDIEITYALPSATTIQLRVNKTADDFREGFRQALRGETYPIETLWNEDE